MESLGRNIRVARLKKSLSLQELAGLAQVSPGFLSQIENGKNYPSLTTLKKLSACLGISISALLGEKERRTNMLVRARERHVLRNLADGAMSLEFLTAFDPKNNMEACIHNLGPGEHSNASPAMHEGQEVMYVLEGRLDVQVDGDVYAMEEGDCFMLNDCMLAHQFRNPNTTENAKMLVVTSPPFFSSRGSGG